MANVDLRRYKKLVQLFWDPEPKNDEIPRAPIWCLGKEFAPTSAANVIPLHSEVTTQTDHGVEQKSYGNTKSQVNGTTKSEGVMEVWQHGSEDTGGWPPEFLDYFESRLWFTYRSNFPPIKKFSNPTTSPALSLSVRLRSQLVDHGGFTTDTGWGCMIRSGQCLLGNALSMLRFGRGKAYD